MNKMQRFGPRARPQYHWLYDCIAIAAIGVFVVRLAASVGSFSHTFDEPYHLAASVGVWQTHRLGLGIQHPPIPRLAAGLPLYLSGVRVREEFFTPTYRSDFATFGAGEPILFDGPLPYETILARSRLAMLIFPVIALWYVYRMGKWLAGKRVAALAAVFCTLDPTLLGHGMWVTTDAAGAAGALIGAYHGLRFIAKPNWRNTLIAAAALALAIGCKLSCVLLVPALAVILVCRHAPVLWRPARHHSRWRVYLRRWPSVRQAMALAAVSFVFIWAIYLFDVGRLDDQDVFDAARFAKAAPAWLRHAPVPMPSFFLGLGIVLRHSGGHNAYLLGQCSTEGWWYYFPVCLLVKSTVGSILGMVLAAGVFLCGVGRRYPWRSFAVLVVPVVFLLAAMNSHINIGIRHLLPALPFLYLFVALHLQRGWRCGVLLAVMALAAVETAAVHPDYIAFFNRAAGGPEAGDRYLDDSNLDWGQDLSSLGPWLKTQADGGRTGSCRLFSIFGERVLERSGIEPDVWGKARPGLFAISRTVKVGSPGIPYVAWLSKYPLVRRFGWSIEVYDLGDDVPPDARSLVSSTDPPTR